MSSEKISTKDKTIQSLTVINAYLNNDTDTANALKKWRGKNHYFSPSTCQRHVYILCSEDLDKNPLPEDSKINLYQGEEAYSFLVEWASGLLNTSTQYYPKYNDPRVLGEVRSELEKYNRKGAHKAIERKPFINKVMTNVLADARKIRFLFREKTTCKINGTADEITTAARRACSYCAYSRINSLAPVYASLDSEEFELYKISALDLAAIKATQIHNNLSSPKIPDEVKSKMQEMLSRLSDLLENDGKKNTPKPHATFVQRLDESTRHGYQGLYNPGKQALYPKHKQQYVTFP